MGFEKVTSRYEHSPSDQPRITIHSGSSTGGYLTKTTVSQYLDGDGYIAYLVDRDYSKLAIEPTTETDPNAYTLSTKSGGGAQIAVKSALQELDINRDDLEESWSFTLEYDEDADRLIADLTDLVNAATDAAACEECGRRCKNKDGLQTHYTKTHGRNAKLRKTLEETDPDEVGRDVPDGDDTYKHLNEKAAGGEQ